MHDIKFIRDYPSLWDEGFRKRGLPPQSETALALDQQLRDEQTRLQQLLQKRNELAKQIGQIKDKQSSEFEALKHEANQLKQTISELEASLSGSNALESLLATLPNLPAEEVPLGKDETGNQEIRNYGTPPHLAFTPKQHFELGEALGMMDFEQTAKISGARFVTLKHSLAKMERALAQFMLDIHTQEFGYMEVSPPYLVRDHAMYGVGQLPKFAEECFTTIDGYRLIPTAEVSLTNLVRERILEEEELPLRFTAYSPCFRSEAGSAGKDTRGMIRQHQFSKVELVSITRPEDSKEEHERMTSAAETILRRLELPYRVMLLCTGDMGFAAQKTYDLEVWLPGQNTYREISSCSNCGNFQARRMKARYRTKSQRESQLVHTLNGSGLAIGRTIVAILENYQQENGTILVPNALRPYLGGLEIMMPLS